MHRAPQAMVKRPESADVSVNMPRDPNTLSNYNNFRTTHTSVNFTIDFERKLLSGKVMIDLMSITQSETKEVILDTSYLKINDVRIAGKSAKWNLGSRFEPYGSPLSVLLEQGVPKDETVQVEIFVSTTVECTALQWLTPAQTSNGKHPYMFSQCQAIHARSLFPCQDTPDVKSTFEFCLRSSLPVVASGLPEATENVEGNDKEKVYRFKQKVPIPSYLFAVASGDITSAPIGPRSTVWTGPEELKAAQWEFEKDTEPYIEAAEKIVYPYAWGTYNVLVLPPSFPYGGMENPIFTFATPTVISGDRQNVDVIAHELSHSWSGNLVSNASWEHFWLNEGWTTYLERRLQAVMHGESARDFSAIIGWKALEDSINQYGNEHEFTKLVVDLKGKDPDDAFSSIPYEKGFTFLYYLEKLVGKEKWDKFIPHYFTKFKYRSLDSYDFKQTLLDFFLNDNDARDKVHQVDWDGWFYKPGFPLKPDFDTTLADACYSLATTWEKLSSGETDFKPSADDIEDFNSSQSVVFLESLQSSSKTRPLRPELITSMGETYGYATTNNVELSSRFFVLGMQAKAKEVYQPAADLLGKVGRMKFVKPLFRHLKQCDEELANRTFDKNKDFYHPICRRMVMKLLFEDNKKT